MMKIICSLLILGAMTACFGFRPFQPAPDEFNAWKKGQDRNIKEIKQALLSCGYPSVYGFDKKNYIPNDVANAENCMFKKGYTYTSGNQGLCSIKDLAGMPACLGKECLNRDAQGCAPINSLYTFFVTENTTVSDVKATMLSCGYPNVYDGNRNYEENELAEKENCMYKNGFNYRAGSGHIRLCEIPSKKNKLTACSPYKSSENIKNLECGIAGALADQSSGTCNNTAHF